MKTGGVLKDMMDETMELQIAPLIDCVFQLLIYFMVATSLHKTEADLGIQLPGTVMTARSSQMQDEQIVEIDATGRVLVNGKVYDTDGKENMPELTATLTRYRLAYLAAKNKALVTIMAEDESKHQRVVDVLNACAAAGIKDVTFTQ